MELNFGYLSVFVVYLLVVLGIGLWGFKRESYDAYTVAENNVSLPLSVGSFFATYISSATVIGFVGYVTLYGASIFPTYYWGFALGWILLTLAAGKMRRLKLRSIPSLFEARFKKRALRTFSAVVIVVAFAFSVMTQLVAGSLVLEVVVGIPQVLSLILLSVVLTIYTVLGGLVSVVRTDFLQGGLILLAVIAAIIAVIVNLGADAFTIDPARTDIFGGSVTSGWDAAAFVLVALGGVAAQPYYLHRFSAAKNVATARQMIGVGALLAAFIYMAMIVIGIALPQLVPEDQLGDPAILAFGTAQGGLLGSLLLIGIICAVQSTVDSALHLVGVYTTEDIVTRFRPRMTDEKRLMVARIVTAIMGVVTMLGGIYFVVGEGGSVVLLLNIWLGTLATALLIPLYGTLFWKRITAAGALWSSVGGFVGFFVSQMIEEFTTISLPIHPGVIGFGVSLILVIVVSLSTKPLVDDEVQRKFFGTETSKSSLNRGRA